MPVMYLLIFSLLFLTLGSDAGINPDSRLAVITLDEPPTSPFVGKRSLTARIGDSPSGVFNPVVELTAWGEECSFRVFLRNVDTVSISDPTKSLRNGSASISWLSWIITSQ